MGASWLMGAGGYIEYPPLMTLPHDLVMASFTSFVLCCKAPCWGALRVR
jgi:hypothetical protein